MPPYVRADVRLRDILPKLSVVELRTYAALGLRVNGQGECWPSLKTLAAEARTSERMVSIACHNLEDAGLISVERRGGGRGKTNLYRVRYWAGPGKGNGELHNQETDNRESHNHEKLQARNTVFPEGEEVEVLKNIQRKKKQDSTHAEASGEGPADRDAVVAYMNLCGGSVSPINIQKIQDMAAEFTEQRVVDICEILRQRGKYHPSPEYIRSILINEPAPSNGGLSSFDEKVRLVRRDLIEKYGPPALWSARAKQEAQDWEAIFEAELANVA